MRVKLAIRAAKVCPAGPTEVKSTGMKLSLECGRLAQKVEEHTQWGVKLSERI